MAYEKSILVLDLGSTSGRAFVFRLPDYEIIGSARFEINTIQVDGLAELNPDELFNNILRTLREAIDDARISSEDLLCIGLSVQRSTFITFDKITGRPFHQLISWQDTRGTEFIRSINKSIFVKVVHAGASLAHKITRSNWMKQVSKYHLAETFVGPKLRHIIDNNRKLREAIKTGRAVFGTLDVWLLHKLKHVNGLEKFEAITDISNASSTGHFDPFKMDYSAMVLKLCKIKEHMMPSVVDNAYDFGYTHKSLLGVPIKIATVIADQSASLIGNCCFRNMEGKITIGTGAFLNINTGKRCIGSKTGASPMVAWELTSKKKQTSRVFVMERGFNESSALIKFAQTVGLCSDVKDLSSMAFSVSDTGGVFFIPKFQSMAGFVGYKNSTTKEHLVRALLEAIVFSVAGFFFLTKEETSYHFDKLRIDGGISQNDFICQLIADLINVKIERSTNCELTSYGVAYLSSYICGGGLDELEHAAALYKVERVFQPREVNRKDLFLRYKKFEDIVKKSSKVEL